MIYDEGFEVKIGDLQLFHFSHYKKENGSFKKLGKFVTNCAMTLLGWVYDTTTSKKGCSFG
jgi:hypothetical protein